MSERIRSGTVWVNAYRAVSFLAPSGGFKDSDLGRENGIGAIEEYLNTKSVWINTGALTQATRSYCDESGYGQLTFLMPASPGWRMEPFIR